MSGERNAGSAKRRRERRLRSWLRHERMTVAAELSADLHHSRDGGRVPYVGLRAPKTDSTAVEEEEVHEAHVVPREQKRPPPGERPAPLPEVAGPQAAVTVGYVAAGAPSLTVVPVSNDRIDDAAMQFLLQQSLLARAEEEEKAREESEVKVLEDDLVLREQRLLRLVDELRGAGPECSRLELAAIRWFTLGEEGEEEEEEEEKDEEGTFPQLLFLMSLTILSSHSSVRCLGVASEVLVIGFLGDDFYDVSVLATLVDAGLPEEYIYAGFSLLFQRFLVRQWIHVTASLRLRWYSDPVIESRLLSVSRVLRLSLVPGSHLFSGCREEYRKLVLWCRARMLGLVLLVSTHSALCSLLLFSRPDACILAGIDQKDSCTVHPCCGAEVYSLGLTVQADH